MTRLCGASTSWRWSFRLSVRQHYTVLCCLCAPVPCIPCSLPCPGVLSIAKCLLACFKHWRSLWYIHPTKKTCLRPPLHVHQTLYTARSSRLVSVTSSLLSGVHRGRRRTPAHTPLIPTSFPQPLLRCQLQVLLQIRRRLLPVYEIAETSSHAPFTAVQPTACFPKVRHGTQLAVDRSSRVPATVQRIARLLRAVLVLKPRVYVPDKVVVVVVAHY